MSTIHEASLRRAFQASTEADPGLLSALHVVLDRMHAGKVYSRLFVDAITQGRDGRYDLHDAFAVGWFVTLTVAGDMGWGIVPVGQVPGRDVERRYNDAAMRGLPEPFDGAFVGGRGYEQDGTVDWTAPIVLRCGPHDRDEMVAPPFGAPLEVGTTKASRSVAHIGLARALARWPYDHEHMAVFYCAVRDWRAYRRERERRGGTARQYLG